MNKYRLTLKHDEGIINITVVARNEKVAKQMVMNAENCPERSIVKCIKTMKL